MTDILNSDNLSLQDSLAEPYKAPPRILGHILLAGFLATIPSNLLYEHTNKQNKASCIEALSSKSGVDPWKIEGICSDAGKKNNDLGTYGLLFTLAILPVIVVVEKIKID